MYEEFEKNKTPCYYVYGVSSSYYRFAKPGTCHKKTPESNKKTLERCDIFLRTFSEQVNKNDKLKYNFRNTDSEYFAVWCTLGIRKQSSPNSNSNSHNSNSNSNSSPQVEKIIDIACRTVNITHGIVQNGFKLLRNLTK